MSARRLASLAGLAAAALAVPAFAAPATSAAPAPAPEKAATTVASYTGSSAAEQATNKAFFDAVMRTAVAKQRKTGIAAVTVVYDPSGAPSFANEISQSTQIWNSSVGNVQLVAGSPADFDYREGNDPRGSHAYTDGHGHGYVFIDYAQAQQYNPLRIVAHETGHILGLPDHYEGPCSELMSGGGPGPSCTNAQPDANERARVEQLWANGKTSLGTFATVR